MDIIQATWHQITSEKMYASHVNFCEYEFKTKNNIRFETNLKAVDISFLFVFKSYFFLYYMCFKLQINVLSSSSFIYELYQIIISSTIRETLNFWIFGRKWRPSWILCIFRLYSKCNTKLLMKSNLGLCFLKQSVLHKRISCFRICKSQPSLFPVIENFPQHEFLYNRANIAQGVLMKQNQQKSVRVPTISGYP